MIAYLLLRFVKNSLPLKKLSLQEIYRLISANIFHRRELNELLLGVHEKVKPDKSIGCKQTSLMFA
jgi:hypothetical protein